MCRNVMLVPRSVRMCVGMLECVLLLRMHFCFFKQKTAYDMRNSDWSSDVCSSDLDPHRVVGLRGVRAGVGTEGLLVGVDPALGALDGVRRLGHGGEHALRDRSEEHTSELQSLMRISYAVFCLQKTTNSQTSAAKQTDRLQLDVHNHALQAYT